MPSFTIEDFHGGTVAGSNFVRTIKGCMVDSYAINLNQGEPVTADHSWDEYKDYYIKAKAIDINNREGDWSIYHIRLGDKQPDMPKIYGAVNGQPEIEYEYGFISTDPENDNLTYEIDWGDGNIETDIGPYPSGEIFSLVHSWNKTGSYSIRARVKDDFDYFSNWAEHEISVPKGKAINSNLLELLFERFPYLYNTIRRLIELINIDINIPEI